MVLWDKTTEEEGTSFMSSEVDHKPTLSEIRNIILNWYNTKIDKHILTGFTWKDMSIWLSTENQLNYKVAYDLAVHSNGKILPTFKFGTDDNPTYYTFKSLTDLEDFYIKAMTHVTNTINEGWLLKDSIDWSVYKELLEE